MERMIWLATCGNGCWIGMGHTRAGQSSTRLVLLPGNTGCCGVARGTSPRTVSALPTVAGTIHCIRTSSSGSAVSSRFHSADIPGSEFLVF